MKTLQSPLILVPLALLALPVGGCHIFQALDIKCTQGMPCASVSDADTDTDADTDADSDADTDTDTDSDTQAPTPTQGYAVSYSNGSTGTAIIYEPDGSERRRWSGYTAMTGPIAYDASTDTCYVFQANEVVQMASDGSYSSGNVEYNQTFDADSSSGSIWIDYGTDVGIYDIARGTSTYPFNNTLTDSRGLVVSGGTAYVVDNNSGGPDAYRCDTTGNCTLLYQDFDTTAARGRNVFVGPGDEPYGCTGAGAVYALRDLSSGNTSPTAFFDGASLTDVTDCGWDAGSSEFLLFSPTNGVIRMKEDSTGGVVTPIPSGSSGARAHFYSE